MSILEANRDSDVWRRPFRHRASPDPDALTDSEIEVAEVPRHRQRVLAMVLEAGHREVLDAVGGPVIHVGAFGDGEVQAGHTGTFALAVSTGCPDPPVGIDARADGRSDPRARLLHQLVQIITGIAAVQIDVPSPAPLQNQ